MFCFFFFFLMCHLSFLFSSLCELESKKYDSFVYHICEKKTKSAHQEKIMQKLKNVDFFRRVPIDLTEPSAPGAIISVCAAVFMTYLFVGELSAFLNPEVRLSAKTPAKNSRSILTSPCRICRVLG